MKGIFTLLLSLGTLTSVFAQSSYGGGYNNQDRGYGNNGYDYRRNEQPAPDYNRNGQYGYGYNDRRYDNGGSYDRRAVEEQAEKINWIYNGKINQVQYDRFLNPFEKRRIIRDLSIERDQKIRMLYGGRGYYGYRRGY